MTPSEAHYEILGWDSAMFGFPVARASATEDRTAMAAAVADARRHGVRLVYLLTESDAVARIADSLNGTLIGERVTFARAVTATDVDRLLSADRTIAVEPLLVETPTAELLQLARDAGRYSRFRVDPRVPEGVFERIYDAWIINSLNGLIAENVLVTRHGSTISGLVTVGAKNGRADIGLLSVREDSRGRGLGKALVNATLEWAVRRQLEAAQVVTQRANVAACRLYESCGYTIERGERVFHFWL